MLDVFFHGLFAGGAMAQKMVSQLNLALALLASATAIPMMPFAKGLMGYGGMMGMPMGNPHAGASYKSGYDGGNGGGEMTMIPSGNKLLSFAPRTPPSFPNNSVCLGRSFILSSSSATLSDCPYFPLVVRFCPFVCLSLSPCLSFLLPMIHAFLCV